MESDPKKSTNNIMIIKEKYDQNKNINLVAIGEDESQISNCSITEKVVTVPVKYLVLVFLVIQTSTNILGLRYSRTVKTQSGQVRYLPSTAILCSEILKLTLCYLILLYKKSYDFSNVNNLIKKEVFLKWKDTLKVSVPALLFVIQNNLLFLALTELDAVIYQVTYQLKILTTAVFSVLMLGKRLSPLKCISLLILLIGVCLVQIPTKDLVEENRNLSRNIVGVIFVLIACVISGFSSVYFEKILKGTPVSVWMRNIQLAIFSIIIASVGIIGKDLRIIIKDGFFQGYNSATVFVVCSQGLGGLLIALVVKYADNILKGFATSLSLIISTLMSYYVFQDFVPTKYFFVGSMLVVLSTYLYGCSIVRK